VILREPTYGDCEFIAQCYKNWPESDKGRIFPQDVRNWIKRWRKTSNFEQGLIGELNDVPVGVVIYGQRTSIMGVGIGEVYELVVKDLGIGHGKAMWQAMQQLMAGQGYQAAAIKALPGAIAAKLEDGTFIKTGIGVGSHTGLLVVEGYVTADMEI